MRRHTVDISPKASSFGFFFLVIYSCLVFIRPHEWSWLTIDFPFIRTMLIITFIAYLASVKPKNTSIHVTVLFLLLFVMLMSELRNGRLSYSFPVLMDFLSTAIIPYLLFTGFLISYERHVVIMKVMIIAALFMVYNGYTQVISIDGVGWVSSTDFRSDMDGLQARYVGFLNDPNDMGMFLVMCLPFSYFLAKNSRNAFSKYFYICTLILVLTGIYWSQSRGSILGALVVLASFFYIKYGKVKTFFLSMVSLPIIVVVLSKFRTISTEDASANARIEAWYQGILMFKYRPIVGVGKDSFLEHHYKTAHNSYVLIMSELGALGYILWTFLLISTFFILNKIIHLNVDSLNPKHELIKKEKDLALFCIVGLLGYLSTAFFISRSYVIILYIFMALCMSIFFRLCTLEVIDKSELVKLSPKSFIYGSMSLIVLYFVIRLLL
ncbi:O-antigen ligase family protein [Thalassotalea castellviae]|uniref:O-antigen ligase family protein n=1 Tax=Thalassotalea castellviae TaxID=3075612 RepID=A0ABU3A0U8_9GAMM|nr:O-antigen ligase family protein [Thalassotalea sp. W431]MDT0603804.1 O-antigen ligase family protein [Thalassotalea sp. W431]